MSWSTPPTPLTVLLAAPPAQLEAWTPTLAADVRFQIVATVTQAADLNAQLTHRAPAFLIADGQLFTGALELAQALAGYRGAAWVRLPDSATATDQTLVHQIPGVRRVFTGELNLTAELNALADAERVQGAQPTITSAPAPAAWDTLPAPAPALTGLRVIAVWNFTGGSGKTTVAAHLAYEARRRGAKTLLVGLSAPDDALVGLPRGQATPNILNWLANPTADGLRNAVQLLDGVAGLAGYPAPDDAAQYPLTAETMRALVTTAALDGYSVIVLDAPASERAAPALAAANQVLLVARPTVADLCRTAEALKFAASRSVTANLQIVLNHATPGLLPAAQWQSNCANLAKRNCPPILATLPADPRVPETQFRRETPGATATDFSKHFAAVADGTSPSGGALLPPRPAAKETRGWFGFGRKAAVAG